LHRLQEARYDEDVWRTSRLSPLLWSLGAIALAECNAHGMARSQIILVPEATDDYIGEDNAIQFSDALVGGLHVSALNDFLSAGHSAANPLIDARGAIQGSA